MSRRASDEKDRRGVEKGILKHRKKEIAWEEEEEDEDEDEEEGRGTGQSTRAGAKSCVRVDR